MTSDIINLKQLSEIVSDIDDNKGNNTLQIELCQKAHDLIANMLGPHAVEVYWVDK